MKRCRGFLVRRPIISSKNGDIQLSQLSRSRLTPSPHSTVGPHVKPVTPSLRSNARAVPRSSGAWTCALASSFRAFAAVMVVLIVAGTQARSFALFRCELTGTALSTCCCPGEEEHESPAISRACCCSMEQVDASVPTGSTAPETFANLSYAPQAWLATPVVPAWRPVAVREPQSAGMRRYAQRTRAGPSLVIVNRRLLI